MECVAAEVNGDGLADLLIGAHQVAPNGSTSGKSYMIFDSTKGVFSHSLLDQLGTAADYSFTGTPAAVGGDGTQ
ncbi:hypothetical protein KR52_12415 [Synechococcus sp. KORDI-52]|nr:hypothetical protein KR52_12415 [Synechococcus sp. KORDI-52]